MISYMDKKVFNTLEYNKIIDMLVDLANSLKARPYAGNLLLVVISMKLNQDKRKLLMPQVESSKGRINFHGLNDIKPL